MTKKVSDDDVRALTDPNADPVDREAALRHLAHWEKGKFVHLEPAIAAAFKDPVAIIRGAAVKALVGSWHLSRYVDFAMTMLRDDADWSARADAAYALGSYAKFVAEGRDRILRSLAAAVKRDDDPAVQEAAYEQLLSVVDAEAQQSWTSGEFDRERDADEDLLQRYLNGVVVGSP
jgi:hypothetical protein